MTPSSYNESSRTPYSTSLKPKSATTSTLSHTNERPAGKATATATNPGQLKTRVGSLELLIPQDRDGTFRTELFEKYQRNEKALVLSLMTMYLEGISTRKVRDVTEVLCGTSFSKSTVSNLTRQLDEDLQAWRSRPLEVEYPYLMVDARYEHVRVDHQVVSLGVLIVTGVRADGYREILAVGGVGYGE